MATDILYIFGSVILVSFISLIGIVTLSLSRSILNKCVSFLVALAIGALLGDALIHLIPEALEEAENPNIIPLLVIGGFLLFFLLERYFHWHHGTHGVDEHSKECDINDPNCHPVKVGILGKLILVSDAAHNLIDGMVIAASYFISIEVGIATTTAIILHEIPQEIADFGVLIHAGYTRSRALFLNFISALFAVLGAVITILLGGIVEQIIVWLLPIAAGAFIYIASSDLTPELHKQDLKSKNTLLQLVSIIVGVGAMYLLLFIE
jgi:zinc and cadmium transporter